MSFKNTSHGYYTPHPDYWGMYLHYKTDARGPNFAMMASIYSQTKHLASLQFVLSSHEEEIFADLTREDVRELRKLLQRVEKKLVEKEGEE